MLYSGSSTNFGGSVNVQAGDARGNRGRGPCGDVKIQSGSSETSKSGILVLKSGQGVDSSESMDLSTGAVSGGVNGLSGDISISSGKSDFGSS
jgi:hypothetical protein